MKAETYRGVLTAMLCAVLVILSDARPAAAQAATNTSRIEGRVIDESGGVLPGVSITISSPSLQAPELDTVADANGGYRFVGLPRGVYTVTFSLSGFQKLTRQVDLASNFTATIDARMNVGQLEESVTVTAESPLIDVRTTTTVTNIKKDVVETLPTARSFEDMGKLAPGIRVSGVPDVGGNHTGGGRSTLINYGSSNGGSTLMLEGINTEGTGGWFDMGAIDEMVVRAAGNDPEIPTPGMAFQVILKSGGNAFHGDGLVAGQTRKLQGDNVTDELKAKGVRGGNPMDHYFDLNGSLGGRIVRDRLWFFGSARKKEYQQLPIGFSGEPGADGAYFTADDVPGKTTDQEISLTGKATARLTGKQNASWMHQFNKKLQLNSGGSQFIPGPAATNYRLPSNVLKGEWTYAPSDRSFLRASIGRSYWQTQFYTNSEFYGAESDKPSSVDTVTLRRSGAPVTTGVAGGASPTGSDSSRWQYDATYTYFKQSFLGANHEFKAGGFVTREWYNRYQLLRGPGTGGTGHDYQLTFSNGTPVEVLLFNSPFYARNNVNYYSGYIRDSIRAGSRLSIDLGLRLERYRGFLPEQSKEAGPFSAAAQFPAQDLYDWRAISPRFGVSYALTADNKTVLKATYGRFNFALRATLSDVVRAFNKNDYTSLRYRWNDLNGNKDLDYPQEIGAFVGTDGITSSGGTVFNPDLTQPYTDELTAHIERQLPGGVAVRAGYVYKKESDLFQIVNTARPYSVYNVPIRTVDPGPDGAIGNADDRGSATYYDYDPAYRGASFEKATYINTPGYTDRYHNLEFGMDKRMAKNWQFIATYLATRKNNWIAGVPQTPNEEFFPKNETWETTYRVSGSYQAPWGIVASGLFESQSGTPLARDVLYRTGLTSLASLTLRMEPVGNQRLPAVRLLNVRATKELRLRGGNKFSAQFDLYNALNASEETTASFRSGPTYGSISAILPPRVARLGLSYSF